MLCCRDLNYRNDRKLTKNCFGWNKEIFKVNIDSLSLEKVFCLGIKVITSLKFLFFSLDIAAIVYRLPVMNKNTSRQTVIYLTVRYRSMFVTRWGQEVTADWIFYNSFRQHFKFNLKQTGTLFTYLGNWDICNRKTLWPKY